ncbi:hypothetical protein TIFTF001_027855 [Ficus carica]|uniref:Uncharacterized protein n=1 Tax=Ficus carica TaxID=3494 RepID=A0AA88DNR1_FICCA|nr:hypothetical protein TIFTF001_027855 [Ficus carica]
MPELRLRSYYELVMGNRTDKALGRSSVTAGITTPTAYRDDRNFDEIVDVFSGNGVSAADNDFGLGFWGRFKNFNNLGLDLN